MNTNPKLKLYPRWHRIVLLALMMLLIVAGFNLLVDPYYLSRTPIIDGVNDKKPNFFFHLGAVKPYHFLAKDTHAVIIGSSRVGSALDPAYQAIAARNYYNLASPGARIRQIDQAVRAAALGGEVTEFIIGLDFFGFNSHGDLPPMFADAYERRMTQYRYPFLDVDFLQQAALDYSSSLLAYQALKDSIETLKSQQSLSRGEKNYFTLFDNGHWLPTYQANRNQLRAFLQSENSYLNGNWFPKQTLTFSLQPFNGYDPLTVYRDMLAFAYRNQLTVKLVLLPVHARLLETLDRSGLWHEFENWKKLLVVINQQQADKLGVEPYRLWDFLAYSDLTTEKVDESSGGSELVWFYDSSHASANAGNLVLDVIEGNKKTDAGRALTMDNVDEWLEDIRLAQQNFRFHAPDIAEGIQKRVEKRKVKLGWVVLPLKNSELKINELTEAKHSYN